MYQQLGNFSPRRGPGGGSASWDLIFVLSVHGFHDPATYKDFIGSQEQNEVEKNSENAEERPEVLDLSIKAQN